MKNLGLSIVSALVILFLVEMTLRATELVPYRTLLRADAAIADPDTGPFLPGQNLTVRTVPALPYRVSINEQGFRGSEIGRSKAPDTVRIVAIGGSHTFGTYVDGDDTWPARLETYLRTDHPDLALEVINAGVDGLDLAGTASLLQERVLALEPDLVILGHSLDSILAPATPGADLEPPARPWSTLRDTATVNLIRMVGSYILGPDRSKSPDRAARATLLESPDGAETRRRLERYGRRLAEIKELLDEDGVPCFVLLFPSWEQVARRTGDAVQRRLGEIHREVGISAVDLLPSYRRYDSSGSKYFLLPDARHPSPRGYRRGARELSSALRPLLSRWEAEDTTVEKDSLRRHIVTQSDPFTQVKTHLATLDDLGQDRRRLYTDWAVQRSSPAEFAAAMEENLRRTQEAAGVLLSVIRGTS